MSRTLEKIVSPVLLIVGMSLAENVAITLATVLKLAPAVLQIVLAVILVTIRCASTHNHLQLQSHALTPHAQSTAHACRQEYVSAMDFGPAQLAAHVSFITSE